MKKYYTDTESVGYYGPTVLIQYSINRNDIKLHNVFDSPVGDTLDLIEDMLDNVLVGFNWVHDGFHFTRTYNILKELPRKAPPSILDYADISEDLTASRSLCLRPRFPIDLMLIARKTKYQAVMNQKPITLRRVPSILAPEIIKELMSLEIPNIYFSKSKCGYHWNTIPLCLQTGKQVNAADISETDIDPNFVDLKLIFSPSTALKAIIESLGHEVVNYDELVKLPNPVEYEFWPSFNGWQNVIEDHLHAWRTDPHRLKYASKDVEFLFILEDDIKPHCGLLELDSDELTDNELDIDSVLAFQSGANHWKGFSVNKEQVQIQYDKCEKAVNEVASLVNFNSPKQVKTWLWDVASDGDKLLLNSTGAQLLEEMVSSYTIELSELNEAERTAHQAAELVSRCKKILSARRASKELQLYKALLNAGALHVALKMLGAKSYRMSGGSENYIKTNGALNPQGIKKDPDVRRCFTFTWDNETPELSMFMDAGDFNSFEVSIAEAVFHEPKLTEALRKDAKTHAVFGAAMYGKTYEEILATSKENINSENGLYQRAKRGFFAMLYMAEDQTLSESMWITREEARAGLDLFLQDHIEIKNFRDQLKRDFTAVKSNRGKYEWATHKEYAESFFGFKRYFTLEYTIINKLYQLATNPTESMRSIADGLFLKRRDRQQTAQGAAASALFAAFFSLQNSIIRAAGNHVIQSPGAHMTKTLQFRLVKLQPVGVAPWHIMTFNAHDEIITAVVQSVREQAKDIVSDFITEYKEFVPFLSMDWEQGLPYWGAKFNKEKGVYE